MYSIKNSKMICLVIPTLLYIICKIDCQTVTITKNPPTAVKVGANVTLICTYNGSASETGVKWFNGSDTTGHAYTSSCGSFPGLAAFYDTTRISASCNSTVNVYNLIITTNLYDKNTLWCCSYQFPGGASPISCISTVQISFEEATDGNPISQRLLLLLLLILLLLLLAIFIILSCCGCLDCCRSCRDFDHYNENKLFYVTWYCIKRGCCSFFFCAPGSKLGWCFWCHNNEMGHCGGCNSCQKKCGCGWPGFFRCMRMRSFGRCYCLCCVDDTMDTGLDDISVPINRLSPTNSNKVGPLPTKLPPISSGETVELKETKKIKKKKNKGKLDLGKPAEVEENTK